MGVKSIDPTGLVMALSMTKVERQARKTRGIDYRTLHSRWQTLRADSSSV